MALFRCASAVVFLAIGSATVANAQIEKPFPTDAEIGLVLTQTDRAIQQYKPLIDQQETQIGKSTTDAVAQDHEVVNALEMAAKALKGKPQALNGPLGFMFFEWIDDALRNAVLCASGASNVAAVQTMFGNEDKGAPLLHLAQSCLDASTLIYTVSESVGALYQRYVEAEDQLANRATGAVEKCMDILKKNGGPPKK
jgi:hypothetical protein